MQNAFDRITHAINAVGNAMFFVIMVIVTINVVLRYVFNTALLGYIEIVQFLQVIAVGLGLAYAQRRKANIHVDMLINILPKRVQKLLEVLTSLVALFVFGVMTFAIYKVSSTSGAMREISDTLELPLYIFRWLLAAGFGLLTLQLLLDFFASARSLFSAEEIAQ